MINSLTQLQSLINGDEGERLEFKAARDSYPKEKLFGYCVALSNEGGGLFRFRSNG